MLRRRLEYLPCAVWAVFVLGCGDPVRTTDQQVCLQVLDSASREPVDGIELFLKDDFESTYPRQDTSLTPENWEYHKAVWERQPWFRGATDKSGKVCIVMRYTALDRSRGDKPPAWRDFVRGKPYLVRIKKPEWNRPGEPSEERVSLLMEPGASAGGKTVSVTLLELQEPQYVEAR
jgi:hypothetical protein